MFASWFKTFSGHSPHAWQQSLAQSQECSARLIRVPTGFGKTFGVVGAWAYKRCAQKRDEWPRRLVYCLPMRVLVEQTEAEVRAALDRVGLLRSETNPNGVAVHVLLGGTEVGEWHLDVAGDAILIGTQDMLLSRALNRGYGSHRARWPMEFGLLHHDVLWVMDEVQLMDVGLATTAQLEAFRQQDQQSGKMLRPATSWWMSATLQPAWLKSVDTAALVDALAPAALRIPPTARTGRLWTDVYKPTSSVSVPGSKAVVQEVVAQTVARLSDLPEGSLTLVVLNTVDRATAVFQALVKAQSGTGTDLRLVHSRFRPAERKQWRQQFLSRTAPIPPAGRVIVATQVVEAGVDLDAALLVTELAPWPSLVQRFGRAARGGGRSEVIVVDGQPADDRAAAPYAQAELAAALDALQSPALADVSPLALEAFEESLAPPARARLYPYQPEHLLLQRELLDLFDTTPDLTGADIDIGRFIRSGDDRDCLVAWMDVATDAKAPGAKVQPGRDELCPAPFLAVREWLCGKGATKLADGVRAWVWDWLDGQWKFATARSLLPGRIVIVARDVGGYSTELGFAPGERKLPPPALVALAKPNEQDLADASQDGEALSEFAYKTIATHGQEVAEQAVQTAQALGLGADLVDVLEQAGQWHDLGKAHAAFQGSIAADNRPQRADLAKAPPTAWPRKQLYRVANSSDVRPGLRHELASMLGLYAVLGQLEPGHEALLGPWGEFFAVPVTAADATLATASATKLLAQDADTIDLIAYLVAAHHGKVRMSLSASPADQKYPGNNAAEMPIRGVLQGDILPPTLLAGDATPLPALTLNLELANLGLSAETGRSWTERTQALLHRHGPFALAYLEACLRAADVQASRLQTHDPLLTSQEVKA